MLGKLRIGPRQAQQLGTILELAAAYGFALAKNHPFVDGNKRIAYASMAVFLELHGYEVNGSELDAVLLMERLAEDKRRRASL